MVASRWLLGFSFQVPGKYSGFLSEGVFSYLPTYRTQNHHLLWKKLLAIGNAGIAGIIYCSQHM